MFVFRTLDISNVMQEAPPDHYPLKLSIFCLCEVVGMAAAKPRTICELPSRT